MQKLSQLPLPGTTPIEITVINHGGEQKTVTLFDGKPITDPDIAIPQSPYESYAQISQRFHDGFPNLLSYILWLIQQMLGGSPRVNFAGSAGTTVVEDFEQVEDDSANPAGGLYAKSLSHQVGASTTVTLDVPAKSSITLKFYFAD